MRAPYLEDGEDGSRKGVKVGRWCLILEVEPEKNETSGGGAASSGASRTWPGSYAPSACYRLQEGWALRQPLEMKSR